MGGGLGRHRVALRARGLADDEPARGAAGARAHQRARGEHLADRPTANPPGGRRPGPEAPAADDARRGRIRDRGGRLRRGGRGARPLLAPGAGGARRQPSGKQRSRLLQGAEGTEHVRLPARRPAHGRRDEQRRGARRRSRRVAAQAVQPARPDGRNRQRSTERSLAPGERRGRLGPAARLRTRPEGDRPGRAGAATAAPAGVPPDDQHADRRARGEERGDGPPRPSRPALRGRADRGGRAAGYSTTRASSTASCCTTSARSGSRRPSSRSAAPWRRRSAG